jgi:hypothetical protein
VDEDRTEVSLRSELDSIVELATKVEEAKELISVLDITEDTPDEAMEVDSTNDTLSVTLADEATDENTRVEEMANEVLSASVDDGIEVSRLELDTTVEDGMRVSLWVVDDTKEVWLARDEATEEVSTMDELTLADETSDDDSRVEEATVDTLDDTIVDDSSICEEAKVEDERTNVGLARLLDTKELSSVDEARLETKVDDGTTVWLRTTDDSDDITELAITEDG